jgi:hypothetical protein
MGNSPQKSASEEDLDMNDASAMHGLTSALDHAVVLVRDQLDAGQAAYAAMGFHITPRGHHSMGTSNNLAIFRDNYLELLGYNPITAPHVAEQWAGSQALDGLVWRCPDVAAVKARCEAAGIAAEEPLDFVRPVETGEGTFDAAFTIVRLKPQEFAAGRSFFCHHKTPELVWREEWQSHANGAINITEFVLAGGEPAEALKTFDKLFGPGLVTPVPGGAGFVAGEARVTALTAEAARERFGDELPAVDAGSTRMVALGISTRSLDMARAALNGGGVPFRDMGGNLLVGPSATMGLCISFHE